MKLRDYQQDSADSVVKYIKKNVSPVLIELATGAGKSLIVSEIARQVSELAPGKKILCVAPSRELVEQNAEKYMQMYGRRASVFCASLGEKCMRSNVIFCSPRTALNNAEMLARPGISAVIIDEAHGITPTLTELVKTISEFEIRGVRVNQNLRVVGMTATPYRTGTGYIYRVDATDYKNEIIHDDSRAISPYFNKLIYSVKAGDLLGSGYLSPLVVGDVNGYITDQLRIKSNGRFDDQSVRDVFEKSSKTEKIISEVVKLSEDRDGVVIFASTISHAEEIAGYLPLGSVHVITGKIKTKDRSRIIKDFKAKKFKFLVNVDVLTTGFDAPHVDVVAVLRATESPGLFQQIVGRGLRISDGKNDCLILDYAENIDRHELAEDIFTPKIKTKKTPGESEYIDVKCPACNVTSEKKRRNDPSYAGLKHDIYGNFLIAGTEKAVRFDDDGQPCEWDGTVMTTAIADPATVDEFGDMESKLIPMPAHYSRRCNNPEAFKLRGVPQPCEHRFSMKICNECHGENDIAARHCVKCKCRLVDPNNKLVEFAGQSAPINIGETRLLACKHATYTQYKSAAGKTSVKFTVTTPEGDITAYLTRNQPWLMGSALRAHGVWMNSLDADYTVCNSWHVVPESVKVKKKPRANGSSFYQIQEINYGKI